MALINFREKIPNKWWNETTLNQFVKHLKEQQKQRLLRRSVLVHSRLVLMRRLMNGAQDLGMCPYKGLALCTV